MPEIEERLRATIGSSRCSPETSTVGWPKKAQRKAWLRPRSKGGKDGELAGSCRAPTQKPRESAGHAAGSWLTRRKGSRTEKRCQPIGCTATMRQSLTRLRSGATSPATLCSTSSSLGLRRQSGSAAKHHSFTSKGMRAMLGTSSQTRRRKPERRGSWTSAMQSRAH